MPMNDYNRSNPFVIIMDKEYDALYNKNVDLIKSLILTVIINGFVLLISLLLVDRRMMSVFINCTFTLIQIYICMTSVKKYNLAIVDKIFNGDNYAVQNINNEFIFEIINKLSFMRGYIESSKKILFILAISNFTINVFLTLDRIIHL